MRIEELTPDITVQGPLFPEPVQVITVARMGASVKLVGKGTHSNSVHERILTAEQLALLTAPPPREPFDGDARKFRLGIEAMRRACLRIRPIFLAVHRPGGPAAKPVGVRV